MAAHQGGCIHPCRGRGREASSPLLPGAELSTALLPAVPNSAVPHWKPIVRGSKIAAVMPVQFDKLVSFPGLLPVTKGHLFELLIFRPSSCIWCSNNG